MTDSQTTTEQKKGRRVTIDLTPAAAEAVDHMREVTGLTTADVFRYAFNLFRFYVDEKEKGAQFQSVGRDDTKTVFELPVAISRRTGR